LALVSLFFVNINLSVWPYPMDLVKPDRL